MKNLIGEYIIEFDFIEEMRWGEFLQDFDNANIYQSWSGGVVSGGERNLNHP